MSFTSKLAIALLLVLALGLPMFITGPSGKPLMSLKDWTPEISGLLAISDQVTDAVKGVQLASEPFVTIEGSVSHTPASIEIPLVTAADPTQLSAPSGKMYKWQDANGRWHFSNQKPLEVAVVTVESLPDVKNVMQAPQAPVTEGKNSSNISLPGGFSFGAD